MHKLWQEEEGNKMRSRNRNSQLVVSGVKCLLDYNNTLTSGAHIKYKFVILILLKMLNYMQHT